MGLLDKLKKTKQEEEKQGASKKQAAPASDTSAEVLKKDADKKTPVPTKATKQHQPTQPIVQPTKAIKHVLLRPVVSEKAMARESAGVYTFVVDPAASKVDIKQAVAQVYGVVPTGVRVTNTEGKRVRFGRFSGKRKDMKKAIVTLPKGKKISIHEGV